MPPSAPAISEMWRIQEGQATVNMAFPDRSFVGLMGRSEPQTRKGRIHIRTTNPDESPFSSLRIRTDAARWLKKADNATAVIWKMLLIAERRFRRLNAPHLLKEVYIGWKFKDGLMEEKNGENVPAAQARSHTY